MTAKNWIGICILSVFMLFSTSTLADLVLAEGGATGQWFNPERSGEGFWIEVINTGGIQQIGISFYTFDANGKQLWVTGSVTIGPDDEVVPIPVFLVEGPSWGPDFDAGDANVTAFGTITVRFPTCDTALFSVVTEVGLQNGSYPAIRLTDIEGVECIDPDPPQQGYTPGLWEGHGICFNVSADGMSIVGGASGCSLQTALDANLDGLSNEGDNCKVTTSCELTWPIVNGQFSCVNSVGEMAIGTFTSNTSAAGFAFEPEGGVGEFCTAVWDASPA